MWSNRDCLSNADHDAVERSHLQDVFENEEEMIAEKPMSENIETYECGDYILTAAIWRSPSEIGLLESFEIGIRNKKSGQFRLLQNRHFNHQSVQEVANAIAHLLGDSGEFYEPEWCIEWFGRE